MLNFDLTEDHRLLEQTVREWAARDVAPRIRELDRAHHIDPAIMQQMASLGHLGNTEPAQ
jgi:alkylation response protein AidB-like acyl-CoA dehydrogenase